MVTQAIKLYLANINRKKYKKKLRREKKTEKKNTYLAEISAKFIHENEEQQEQY